MNLQKEIHISGNEDEDQDPYALNVIVEDTKNFTDYELITAVAKAVVTFVPVPEHMTPESSFTPWVQGRFRKLLKRIKPNYFVKLQQELTDNKVKFYVSRHNNVNLIVVEPLRKSFTLPVFKRAQVSGLKTLDEKSENPYMPSAMMYGRAEITINSEIEMSVSKSAIAAAHAFQLLRDDLFKNDRNTYEVVMRSMPINVVWRTIDKEKADSEFVSVIRDAGLTEVEPGSITAAAKMTGSTFLR